MYDFFIAHAGADRAAAEGLFDLLTTRSRVFLDTRCLKFGDPWDEVLPRAQRQSRVTVVIVSPHTEAAFYQKEEVAAAVDLARRESHRVVPVFVEGGRAARQAPYGLRRLHYAEISDEFSWEDLARELLALVADAPGQEAIRRPLHARGVTAEATPRGDATTGAATRLPERLPQLQHLPGYELAENRLSGRPICSAVWNHAGNLYAVATEGCVELYDRRGAFQRRFQAPTACYLAGRNVQWEPNDRLLAVLSDEGQLDVIDVGTGESIRVVAGSDEMMARSQYSWNRDGSVIAVATVEGVFFASARDGNAELVLRGSHAGVSMSPAEDVYIVSAADEQGPLFEGRRTSDHEIVADVGRAAETGWADSLHFDPAGKLVAVAFEGFGMEIWSWPTRSRIQTLQAPSGVITDVRWSSDGRFLIVTSHERQVVRVYLAETWQLLGELQPRETSRRGVGVNAGSITADGTILLVPQGERGIDVFELNAGAEAAAVR